MTNNAVPTARNSEQSDKVPLASYPDDFQVAGDGRLAVFASVAPPIVLAGGKLRTDFTDTERNFLGLLTEEPDKVRSKRELCLALFGKHDKSAEGALRLHNFNSRQKLGAELGDPETGVIQTIAGEGLRSVSYLWPPDENDIITLNDGSIQVSRTNGRVRKDGNDARPLTRRELEALDSFWKRSGELVLREEVTLSVEPGVEISNLVTPLVYEIRKKLGLSPEDKTLETVPGEHGYRLNP